MSTASIATSPNQQQLGPGSPLPAVAASVNTKYPQRVIISLPKNVQFFLEDESRDVEKFELNFLFFLPQGYPKQTPAFEASHVEVCYRSSIF